MESGDGLGVRGEKRESPALEGLDVAEVPFIEGQQGGRLKARSEDDKRKIGEAGIHPIVA